VHASFLTQAAAPKSLEEFTGAVARADILAGEPITAQRLVRPGDQGFLAALLTPGFRAVALPISRETAASGFIMPNDRVDVLLAREIESDRGEGRVASSIILENIRVLSIGEALRAAAAEPAVLDGSTATLELSPRDAETLAMAQKMGEVRLALRSLDGDAPVMSSRRAGALALDQGAGRDAGGVRVHAFGAVKEEAQ
jgi:pilus assembly protein CpaB